MAKVVVEFKGGIDKRAFIDDKRLTFNGDKAEKNIAAGEHALTWFIQGEPGSNYSIAITEPASAKFKHDDTLDGSGMDAGLKWFTVGGVA